MRINIIGGGLAGCALAYIAKQAGLDPVIYEAAPKLASGASGNDVGLYNPRFTAKFDAVGQFYSAAFFEALKIFEHFGDAVDWNPCGAVHVMTNEIKAKRFPKTLEAWGWGEGDMRLLTAAEASDILGVPIASGCLYLSKSGRISPNKLCAAYARGVDVRLDTRVEGVTALEGVTILANGLGALKTPRAAHLPIKAVRGQVSYIRATEQSAKLKAALCYGGYLAPADENGVHCLGATFQRWLDHSEIIPEDDAENIEKLCEAIPSLRGNYDVVGHRAAVRVASRDHFPIVGQLDENLYISTAHGSHGILSSLLSAKILIDNILGKQGTVSDEVVSALSPQRFAPQ